MSKTWFITGASRGLGADIANAALKRRRPRRRHRPPARGRQRQRSARTTTACCRWRSTSPTPRRPSAAVAAALARFGAHRRAGQQRRLRPPRLLRGNDDADIQAQYATNVFGLFNVTRAALPAMRARAPRPRVQPVVGRRAIAASRRARCTAPASSRSKASRSRSRGELAPFGIHVTIVEPGPFRTDFLTPGIDPLRGADGSPTTTSAATRQRASFEQRNGKQPGDPVRLAEAMVHAGQRRRSRRCASPRARWRSSGCDAKLAAMQAELDRWRDAGRRRPTTPCGA